MKAKHLKTAAYILAGCMLATSCVGSFSLFNKLSSWNQRATKNKFLNELIFLVISPAYVVCGAADFLVINSIEFWSGSNPLAHNNGDTETIKGQDGRYYAVTYLEDGYEIKAPDGQVLKFVYDSENDSWSQIEEGKPVEIFRFNDDGTIQATLPSGEQMDFTLDEAGVFQARAAVHGMTFWAMQ